MFNRNARRHRRRLGSPLQKSWSPPSITIFVNSSFCSFVNTRIVAYANLAGSIFFCFDPSCSDDGQSFTRCPVFLQRKHFPCLIKLPLSSIVNASTSIASVTAALSWCFAILVNKFCKIMKIFERLDHLRNRWVLCQH
jgi:hypothetical protein